MHGDPAPGAFSLVPGNRLRRQHDGSFAAERLPPRLLRSQARTGPLPRRGNTLICAGTGWASSRVRPKTRCRDTGSEEMSISRCSTDRTPVLCRRPNSSTSRRTSGLADGWPWTISKFLRSTSYSAFFVKSGQWSSKRLLSRRPSSGALANPVAGRMDGQTRESTGGRFCGIPGASNCAGF